MPKCIDSLVLREGLSKVSPAHGSPERRWIETWKGIAGALERSERWCRYMARRAYDPLPVFKIGGIVCLGYDDLDAWLLRQRAQAVRSPGLSTAVGMSPFALTA